jgi:hypothetical protein
MPSPPSPTVILGAIRSNMDLVHLAMEWRGEPIPSQGKIACLFGILQLTTRTMIPSVLYLSETLFIYGMERFLRELNDSPPLRPENQTPLLCWCPPHDTLTPLASCPGWHAGSQAHIAVESSLVQFEFHLSWPRWSQSTPSLAKHRAETEPSEYIQAPFPASG